MRALVGATISALWVGVALSPVARAWPPTFGAEFTFTNESLLRATTDPGMVNTVENEWARDTMARIMEKKCAVKRACQVKREVDRRGAEAYRVTYEDGWWFRISVDPAVVEIQAKPSTLDELRTLRERIQGDIFESAAQAGVRPHASVGGGHIHIGANEAFGEDAGLFRNFVVDYANHSELASGVLAKTFRNAPPLAALDSRQRRAFARLIEKFDQEAPNGMAAIRDLAKKIHTRVYTQSLEGERFFPACKYQALCLTRLATKKFPSSESTVEIRAVRPQRSVDDFIAEAHAFQARLELLKRIKVPVPFADPEVTEDLRKMVDRFYRYVGESGLDWEVYRQLLPGPMQVYEPSHGAREAVTRVRTRLKARNKSCLATLLADQLAR